MRRTTRPEAPELTSPRPDLYVALPIFKKNSQAAGFYNEYCIQNFTETRLAILEEVGNGNLISNPIIELHKKLGEKHRICFPCVVVEIKHHEVPQLEIEKCYCQAANGTAAALSILSRLSYLSTPLEFCKGIQPVVAFTFIGYKSRVWIAFINNKLGDCDPFRCEYVSHSSVPIYAMYIHLKSSLNKLNQLGEAMYMGRRSAPNLGCCVAMSDY